MSLDVLAILCPIWTKLTSSRLILYPHTTIAVQKCTIFGWMTPVTWPECLYFQLAYLPRHPTAEFCIKLVTSNYPGSIPVSGQDSTVCGEAMPHPWWSHGIRKRPSLFAEKTREDVLMAVSSFFSHQAPYLWVPLGPNTRAQSREDIRHFLAFQVSCSAWWLDHGSIHHLFGSRGSSDLWGGTGIIPVGSMVRPNIATNKL